MAEINQSIPPEIWRNIDDDAPWETLPISYAKRLQEDIEIHMKKRYPMYNYYCLPQPDSAYFDTSWSQLYLGRPTQSLGFTSKYGENTPEGQAHRERLWKMLHDNISSSSLTNLQESSTSSQTETSVQPILTPHQLDVTQYMIRNMVLLIIDPLWRDVSVLCNSKSGLLMPKRGLRGLYREFCNWGGPRLVNQCPLIGKSAYEENGSRKCCLSDSGLAAVGDGFTKLESLKLMWCPNVTDVGLISIAEKCKLLKSLDLQECCVRDKGLAAIGEFCTRLEDLNLWRCNSLTDTGLAQLALGCGRTLKSLGLDACQSLTDVSLEAVGFHCQSLEFLSLDSEFIHDKGLLAVAKGCTQLKSLKLECSNITDEALQAVGSFCLLLELLALYSCGQLTDKSLFSIGEGCKKLKNLILSNCSFMSDMGLDSIAVGCEVLMHLEVSGCDNIGAGSLKSIGKSCTRLSGLALRHWRFLQIENYALCDFGIGCKYLQSLHLFDCSGIGDEGLCAIARGCRNLKKLNIIHCHGVGNEGIVCVGQNCKFLTDLVLQLCDGVGDDGIIAIARGCPQLSYLDVSGLKNLGENGMAALGEGCPLLKGLVISRCPQISNVGLSYIAKNCMSLESCNMIYCPSITHAGVTTLITGCQNIKKLLVEDHKVSSRTKRRAHHLLTKSWPRNHPIY
ncbi:F-box/LRR-repeat protein 4 [Abeliophyllum distichum]|uniref:F-box/LRR-repeat protein 4 n=1 Tax=Abeliophyllum distichum TaxID=126358 RepID=A0ABD1T086_9LAMI